MRLSRWFPLLACVPTFLLAVTLCHADAYTKLNASEGMNHCTAPFVSFNQGPVTSSTAQSLGSTTVTNGCGTATLSGSVDYGAMTVSSEVNSPNSAGATSAITLSWHDVLYFTGPANSEYQVSYQFTTSTSSVGNTCEFGYAAAVNAQVFNALEHNIELEDSDCAHTPSQSGQFDLFFNPGQSLTLNEVLFSTVSIADIDNTYSKGAGTLILNIDPITAGAGYTSDSGHDYRTPVSAVPEPASSVLVAGGIFGLLKRRAGRKSLE